MLHNHFIACITVCAFLALSCMIDNGDFEYIILPIGIILWTLFKFFDENDRKYLKSKGINLDKFNPLFPEDYDYGYSYYDQDYTTNDNVVVWNNVNARERTHKHMRNYQNPIYKNIVGKCKRNFKIELTK